MRYIGDLFAVAENFVPAYSSYPRRHCHIAGAIPQQRTAAATRNTQRATRNTQQRNMFVRPNGKSRPPSDGGHGHGRKRRSHKVAPEISGVLDAPFSPPAGLVQLPMAKKKLEMPLAVSEKGDRRANQSRECNDSVAELEEAVKRLERKMDEQRARAREDLKAMDEQHERVREDLKALEARVREDVKAVGQVVVEAVGRFARRGQEDGAAIAAQREAIDRWKQASTAMVEQLRQGVAGLAVASTDRGRTEAQSRPDKRPAVKKKLEWPLAAPEKGLVVEKVGPEAETEGVVLAVDDATQLAEGSASGGEASAILGTDGGPAAAVYKKPAFLAKK
jgi:hypothetical protein